MPTGWYSDGAVLAVEMVKPDIAAQVACCSSQNAQTPSTGSLVQTWRERSAFFQGAKLVFTTQPLVFPLSLYALHIKYASDPNIGKLLLVSMETYPSHQYRQEIMLQRREWAGEG